MLPVNVQGRRTQRLDSHHTWAAEINLFQSCRLLFVFQTSFYHSLPCFTAVIWSRSSLFPLSSTTPELSLKQGIPAWRCRWRHSSYRLLAEAERSAWNSWAFVPRPPENCFISATGFPIPPPSLPSPGKDHTKCLSQRTIRAPVTMTRIAPCGFAGCASVVSTRCCTFWKGRLCSAVSICSGGSDYPDTEDCYCMIKNRIGTTDSKFLHDVSDTLDWGALKGEHGLIALRNHYNRIR